MNRLEINNKKGDISINILVLMTLAVVCLALFYFSQDRIIENKISNAGLLDSVYGDETNLLFLLDKSLESSLLSSYNTLASGCDLSREFCGFDANNVDNGLKESVIKKFKESANKYPDSVSSQDKVNYYKEIKENVNDNKYDIQLNGKEAILVVPGFLFSKAINKSKIDIFVVEYRTDLVVNLTYVDLGIIGFKEIYERSKSCLSVNTENCLKEKLNLFNVEVSKSDKGYIIFLESRKLLLIDGESKKIKFNFFLGQ
jgi:hypothetical protein